MHLQSVTIDQQRFPTREFYPFNLPLLQNTDQLNLRSRVIIFTGENGTGKTTLLKALCRRCRIHIWEGQQRTPYTVNRYENMLHHALNIAWTNGSVPGSFFSPALFRNFSQLVDEWANNNPQLLEYFGGKSLMDQSQGQSCMAYFSSIYRVKGLHFLDEPESALSPATQLELLDLLEKMSAAGHAQFVVATHSPIIMSCPDAVLYSFDRDRIRQISYKDTQHYKVYKAFFCRNA